jgi:hypothetical protein
MLIFGLIPLFYEMLKLMLDKHVVFILGMPEPLMKMAEL